MKKIETILLDYQSRTSVELLKILAKEYWKIDPVFEETTGEYQRENIRNYCGFGDWRQGIETKKDFPIHLRSWARMEKIYRPSVCVCRMDKQ